MTPTHPITLGSTCAKSVRGRRGGQLSAGTPTRTPAGALPDTFAAMADAGPLAGLKTVALARTLRLKKPALFAQAPSGVCAPRREISHEISEPCGEAGVRRHESRSLRDCSSAHRTEIVAIAHELMGFQRRKTEEGACIPDAVAFKAFGPEERIHELDSERRGVEAHRAAPTRGNRSSRTSNRTDRPGMVLEQIGKLLQSAAAQVGAAGCCDAGKFSGL